MKNSDETPFPPRPRQSTFLFVGGVCAIAVLMVAWWVTENYFGLTLRGRKLRPDETHLSIWLPLATTVISAIVATILYRRERALLVNGKEVTATVSRIGTIVIKEMRDISFTFEWNGTFKAKTKSVTKSLAASLNVGDRLHLLVLPSNPERLLIIEEYGPQFPSH